MVIYSKVKLGVSPDINALASLIICAVGVCVIVAGVVMRRTERRRSEHRRCIERFCSERRLTATRAQIRPGFACSDRRRPRATLRGFRCFLLPSAPPGADAEQIAH